jgi:hypothetical protein
MPKQFGAFVEAAERARASQGLSAAPVRQTSQGNRPTEVLNAEVHIIQAGVHSNSQKSF